MAMAFGGSGGGTMTWHEELASLVGDTGIRYDAGLPADEAAGEDESSVGELRRKGFYGGFDDGVAAAAGAEESLKDQVKGFLAASGEMLRELGRGCWDIAHQSFEGAEDTYVGKKVKEHLGSAARRLEFLNEYLPEDRDPAQSWPVVIGVFFVALIVLSVSSGGEVSVQLPKKIYISPPSASRIRLSDGRYMAYHEQGVQAEKSRFSMIAPHSFLSSRLAGIPGIKSSLLEEFGVRLISYDLPGFGESDPHPGRNLNSSALDMLHLANALGVTEKFWVIGYSGGGMHALAAVHYIPERIAGVAMFAPMVNPYDFSMNKEERRRTWEKWTFKRKFMFALARRFPSLLPYFYRRSFLSGEQGQLAKWLSLSLGKRDKSLLEEPVFHEFWEKDLAESVRQGYTKPFVEEAVLQVSNWGFSLADLQVVKQPESSGVLQWIKSLYSQVEREWAGFLGPIHIWQGMDDFVVPPSMTDFIRRLVPRATIHKILGEGHFSYFYFCDECHRQIFSTLFGIPQGPLLDTTCEADHSLIEEECIQEEVPSINTTEQE